MVMLKNTYRKYTPKEIFNIILEEHRLISPLELEGRELFVITEKTNLKQWRDIGDYLPWDQLLDEYNNLYDINISKNEWYKAVMPEKKKTVWDLCNFMSKHAKKEIINPICILGSECLSAAVFLTLKNNLAKRKIGVRSLRPSTPIIKYLKGIRFTYLIPEILKICTQAFDVFELKLRKDLSFWHRINLFKEDRYYIDTGSIKTFRDLCLRIANQL